MDIATGVPVGDLEHDMDVYHYLKTTADALAPLIMIGSVPSVANFLQIPFIAKRLYPAAEDKIGFGRLIGYVHPLPLQLLPRLSLQVLHRKKLQTGLLVVTRLKGVICCNLSSGTV